MSVAPSVPCVEHENPFVDGPVPVVPFRPHAEALFAAGFALTRLEPGAKTPAEKGWSSRSARPEDFDWCDNGAIVTGALSNGNRQGCALVTIDLDAARAVELAPQHLPR